MFSYLLDKITNATFETEPFRHLYIEGFLNDQHFADVISSPQISIEPAKNSDDLFDKLESNGYKIISFPGTTSSKKKYIKWLQGKKSKEPHKACEGFGVTMRIQEYSSPLLESLNTFFHSDEIINALKEKFQISRPVRIDAGIQKYLHGYEISPHPDVRSKALTWMLNINPSPNSESLDFHTYYLKFKDEWKFVQESWESNLDVNTCWVPWDWCDKVKQQRKNNSIVIFMPTSNTIHAVKAHYNHLATQRTQCYGNLWYTDAEVMPQSSFTDFIIS